MPATTYIVIDSEERITVRGRHEYLDGFLRALAENPVTIGEFICVYEGAEGRPFTDDNRTGVPGHDIDEAQVKPDSLTVDPVEIEVGYALIPLVDTNQGGDLIERINMIRSQMYVESGLVLPPVRIHDNMQLDINEYKLKINGAEVARGQAEADKLLAMDAGLAAEKLEGIQITEPILGCPAVWIDKTLRDSGEARGYTVVTPSAVIAAHLSKVADENVGKILARQKQDQEDPEAFRKSLIDDGIIEADLRTRTLRYITNGNFVVDSEIIPDWTVIVE